MVVNHGNLVFVLVLDDILAVVHLSDMLVNGGVLNLHILINLGSLKLIPLEGSAILVAAWWTVLMERSSPFTSNA